MGDPDETGYEMTEEPEAYAVQFATPPGSLAGVIGLGVPVRQN